MTIDLTNIRAATVLEEVAAEREKQRAKWGDAHDDGHTDEALVDAAVVLATVGDIPFGPAWAFELFERLRLDRRRQLIIAAALLIAEVERLDRLEVA